MQIDAVQLVGVAFGVALFLGWPFALIWGMGALTRHLRDKRLGPKPYKWQSAQAGAKANQHVRQVRSASFWTDLKDTATKRYGDKTTLEKAYGACVLLFVVAVFPMPYEYYFSLRLAVCVALWFFAVAAFRSRPEHNGWLTAIVVLMVLYNPIMPFHIGVQMVWTAINAATIYALYRAKLALDRPATEPSETVT